MKKSKSSPYSPLWVRRVFACPYDLLLKLEAWRSAGHQKQPMRQLPPAPPKLDREGWIVYHDPTVRASFAGYIDANIKWHQGVLECQHCRKHWMATYPDHMPVVLCPFCDVFTAMHLVVDMGTQTTGKMKWAK